MSSRTIGSTSSATNDEWKAKTDPNSGQTYYYNRRLKQTAWEIPDPSLGPGHWVEQESETGETIWYNPVTKARSYMKPEDVEAAQARETVQRTLGREER